MILIIILIGVARLLQIAMLPIAPTLFVGPIALRVVHLPTIIRRPVMMGVAPWPILTIPPQRMACIIIALAHLLGAFSLEVIMLYALAFLLKDIMPMLGILVWE